MSWQTLDCRTNRAIRSGISGSPGIFGRLSHDGPLHLTRDGFDLAVRVGLDAEGLLSAMRLMDNPVALVASSRFLEHHPHPLDRADGHADGRLQRGPA